MGILFVLLFWGTLGSVIAVVGGWKPFVWFVAIFPVVLFFFGLNLTWGVVIIRRHWPGVKLLAPSRAGLAKGYRRRLCASLRPKVSDWAVPGVGVTQIPFSSRIFNEKRLPCPTEPAHASRIRRVLKTKVFQNSSSS